MSFGFAAFDFAALDFVAIDAPPLSLKFFRLVSFMKVGQRDKRSFARQDTDQPDLVVIQIQANYLHAAFVLPAYPDMADDRLGSGYSRSPPCSWFM